MGKRCEVCGFESSYEDEVCYYDINGYAIMGEDVERYGQDPDALAHCLCSECADKMFNK